MNRRHFILQTLGTAALAGIGTAATNTVPDAPSSAGHARPAQIESSLVAHFVSASHDDLLQTKAMLARERRLIFATYDWGAGDWESALGAAAHMGNRDIANHLLSQGARIDVFCAAMLGATDVVVALIRFASSIANARGPHGYSLFYHVGYSGDMTMTEAVAAHIANRNRDFNQAVHTATRAGRVELLRWLLKNGVSNVNTKDDGLTPLELALKSESEEIARLLRDHGGKTSAEMSR